MTGTAFAILAMFTIHHEQQLKIGMKEMSNAATTIEAEISYSLERKGVGKVLGKEQNTI